VLWGVCPEHGGTLKSSGGRAWCTDLACLNAWCSASWSTPHRPTATGRTDPARALEAPVSDQPAPDDASHPAVDREALTPDDAQALRAYAARTRENADLLAAVLEDIALNGLPNPEACTPWEELRERKLAQLHAARGHVA
jgi:hypothetical protein